MPFDRFTIEQLAGDLLPGATLDQKIATGFNRNHRGNGEGGIIPEEYAVEYVVDRVDTTATVWLGLTLGCARCHSHKFDPITQEEFYRFFAFFNNVPENGRAIKFGNSPPMIKAPTRAQQQELDALQAGWRTWSGRSSARAGDRGGPGRLGVVDRERPRSTGLDDHWSLGATTIREPGSGRTSSRIPRRPSPIHSRSGRTAIALDGRAFLDAGDVAGFGFYDKFTLSAWIKPDGRAAAPSSRGWSTSRRARVTASCSTGARSRSTWSSAGWTTRSASRRRRRFPPASGRTSR